MPDFVVAALSALLGALGWFLVGYYKSKHKTSEALNKADKKANEIKTKVKFNIDNMRERTRKLFLRR